MVFSVSVAALLVLRFLICTHFANSEWSSLLGGINPSNDLLHVESQVKQALPPVGGVQLPQEIAESKIPENPSTLRDVETTNRGPVASNDRGVITSSEDSNETDEDNLMFYLTQYRNRARRTEKGYLCAAAFVEKNQVYTDCTLEVAPDGTTDREWCYLEAQLTGKLEKDWGFCVPPLSYGRIREAVTQRLFEKVSQVDEMRKSLNTYRKLIWESEKRLLHCCGKPHEDVVQSISRIESMLEDAKGSLHKIREDMNAVAILKDHIKKCQCNFESMKRHSKGQETYEGIPVALSDGLLGTYYSGHLFKFPAFSSRLDAQINFVFANSMPILGLSPNSFSIRWEGYLKAPHSGNFVFELDTESFCRLEFNGEEIINNGIRREGDESTGILYWVDPLDLYQAPLISQSQRLIGGKFYKIKIEFSHSQQFKFLKGDESFVKLLWTSFRIKREIVPSSNLFSRSWDQHMSISGLPLDYFEIRIAKNGEFVHRDSEEVFVANLSRELIGAYLVRCDQKPKIRLFTLQVNNSGILYVVYIKSNPFPLELRGDFHIPFKPSNLKVDFINPKEDKGYETDIKQIALMPGVNYYFHSAEVGTPFLLLIKQHKQDHHCDGKERLLSIPGSEDYLSCLQSSVHSASYDCNAAFSGKFLDLPNSIWKTTGDVGEYVKVIFKRPVLVTKFQFRPRDSPNTWPSKISLEMDDDVSETFSILHSNNMEYHVYNLSQVSLTTFVRIIIEELYVASSNEIGGSFGVWGVPCYVQKEELGLIEIHRCGQTLGETIEVMPIENGESFLVDCRRECLQTAGNVITEGPFDASESICSAAARSGNCNLKRSCTLQLHVEKYLTDGKEKMQFYLFKPPKHLRNQKNVFHVKILFRNQSVRLPVDEYLVDNGAIKSTLTEFERGLLKDLGSDEPITYGWLRPATGPLCPLGANPLYGGGIEFQSPKESLKCIQKENCEANYWSIDLPRDGKYKVEIMLGSYCTPSEESEEQMQIAYLELNGEVLLSGQEFEVGKFYTIVKELNISNRVIKLSSTCASSEDTYCTDLKTIIQTISIQLL